MPIDLMAEKRLNSAFKKVLWKEITDVE